MRGKWLHSLIKLESPRLNRFFSLFIFFCCFSIFSALPTPIPSIISLLLSSFLSSPVITLGHSEASALWIMGMGGMGDHGRVHLGFQFSYGIWERLAWVTPDIPFCPESGWSLSLFSRCLAFLQCLQLHPCYMPWPGGPLPILKLQLPSGKPHWFPGLF